MIKELVSIITPCYNGSKYVSETIESVLKQTYKNWEMLIVDDGSKDNSAEIISSYAKNDNRIRLIQQPNGGSANARNHAIREAQGQYITLLDADDLWEPNFLEEQIQFLKEKNAELIYSSFIMIDENSKVILKPYRIKEKVTYKQMLVTDYIPTVSGFYDCSRIGKVYLHEELKSLLDDYAFWIDIIKETKIAYGNPKILARYRVLANSATGNKKKMIKKHILFYRNYLKLSWFRCFYNTFVWGVRGLRKYKK